MGMFLFVLLSFLLPSSALDILVVGSPSYWTFLKSWADGYKLLVPDFNLVFQSSGSGTAGIAQLAIPPNGNQTIDIVLCDGTGANTTQYEVGLQAFPFLITTMVAQINLGIGQDILLNNSVLGAIFMGNITNWADPQIAATNPGIKLPNATIQVFYRSDTNPASWLWTDALATWSPLWSAAYGGTGLLDFPYALRNQTNFYGEPDILSINGAVAGTLYSIGYVQYYIVARDTGLHYAHLYNKYSGQPVTAGGGGDLTEAADFLPLNTLLQSTARVDPQDNKTWPIIATVGLMVKTNPDDCDRARAVYKFVRWAFTADSPRQQTIQLGGTPLNTNLTNCVLEALAKIQCGGESIASYQLENTPDLKEDIGFAISNIVLLLALILSCLHFYHSRNSRINLIYTTVFIFGTILTLISPIFWYLEATSNAICQCRVWTMSLGFSIILGTMFSRTWQLQEIYYLQKKGLDELHKQISTHRTYIQLAVTLIACILVNFIILAIWTGVDPLVSSFVVDDEVNLTGYWSCQSNNVAPWVAVEIIFFLSLLCFGVYVIYETWSFQRRVILTETRWVLFALYNVILNIVALLPFIAISSVDEHTLSFIIIASIDLSAGSIACAVLLPRVIENFKLSRTTKGSVTSGRNNSSKIPEGSLQGIGIHHHHNKKKEVPRSVSRTPEEELAKKLEDPRPLTMFASSVTAIVELQPLSSSVDFESRTANSHSTGAPQEGEIDSPSQHPPHHRDSMQWADNPIKDERDLIKDEHDPIPEEHDETSDSP